MPLSLFISYSHKDTDPYLKDLQMYVNKQGCPNIDVWVDMELVAGEAFEETINQEMNRADIVLFLISPFFQNSRSIERMEFDTALERRKKQLCEIVPIKVRTCVPYERIKPILKLKGFPEKGFLSTLRATEQVWDEYTIIQNEINRLANKILATKKIPAEDIVRKEISKISSRKKIFLSIPGKDSYQVRNTFLSQLEAFKKKSSLDFEVVPDKDTCDEFLEDLARIENADEQAAFRKAFFDTQMKDTFCSIHLTKDGLMGSNEEQFRVAKSRDNDGNRRKVVVCNLTPEISIQLGAQDYTNVVFINGEDYSEISKVVQSSIAEKSEQIEDLTDEFALKKVLVITDLKRDAESKRDKNATQVDKLVSSLFNRDTCVLKKVPNSSSGMKGVSGALLYWGDNDEKWFQTNAKDMISIKKRCYVIDTSDAGQSESKRKCIKRLLEDSVIKPEDIVAYTEDDIDAALEKFVITLNR